MELSSLNSYFDNTKFDLYYTVSNSWRLKQVSGQLKIADDFISIFNRPTRRRMLLVSPKAYQKVSLASAIRVSNTGDVYLLGNAQTDISVREYRKTIPLNKVSSIGTVNRKATIGPANDPGVLVTTLVGTILMDIELRTITATGDTQDSEYMKFFAWFPKDSAIVKNDQVTSAGKVLRVIDLYTDTGFLGARLTSEPDSREDFVYNQVIGPPTHVVATGVSTPNEVAFNISAELSEITQRENDFGKTNRKNYIVIIEYQHIGIIPSVGDTMVINGGVKRVRKVTRDRHRNAWKLELLQ